jgi:IclR family KDG regulon transcriptional repressor
MIDFTKYRMAQRSMSGTSPYSRQGGLLDSQKQATKGTGDSVEAVEKALQILEAVGAAKRIGVLKLSQEVELPYSTVHRLLSTLAKRGYIQQESDRRKYALGPKVLELGTAFLDTVELRQVALPRMLSLSQQTRETVNLVIWNGRSAVCAEKIDSPESVTVQQTQIGRLEPLHSSGLGKAIIAFLPAAQLDEVLNSVSLVRYTRNTLVSVKALKNDLEKIRQRGFAIDDQEGVLGVRCVASPIWNYREEVLGALSLVGPSIRMSKKRVLDLGRMVREEATKISQQLGYNPQRSARSV